MAHAVSVLAGDVRNMTIFWVSPCIWLPATRGRERDYGTGLKGSEEGTGDFSTSYSSNQATGYASQHIWCLSQARINWEGCVRKGIWHKNGGMAEMGERWERQLVWMGWQSIQIVGVSACVIFILHQKIQKMAKCTFWYQLTRVIPDKVQRDVKWLCVCVTVQT